MLLNYVRGIFQATNKIAEDWPMSEHIFDEITAKMKKRFLNLNVLVETEIAQCIHSKSRCENIVAPLLFHLMSSRCVLLLYVSRNEDQLQGKHISIAYPHLVGAFILTFPAT